MFEAFLGLFIAKAPVVPPQKVRLVAPGPPVPPNRNEGATGGLGYLLTMGATPHIHELGTNKATREFQDFQASSALSSGEGVTTGIYRAQKHTWKQLEPYQAGPVARSDCLDAEPGGAVDQRHEGWRESRSTRGRAAGQE